MKIFYIHYNKLLQIYIYYPEKIDPVEIFKKSNKDKSKDKFEIWISRFIKYQKVNIYDIDKFPNTDILNYLKFHKLSNLYKSVPQIWSLKNLKKDFYIDKNEILNHYEEKYHNLNYKFVLKCILYNSKNPLYESINDLKLYAEIKLY